jgi:pimeloyl-ACP methyl ester carboxylesterase
VLRVILAAAAAVALLLVLVWGLQRHLVYLPASAPVPPAGSVIPGARDLVLETDDGIELGAWFVPAREPDRNMAVLVANGNAGNRAARAPLARALSDRGLSVLLFDYRGYGGNAGSPSEEGLARDARAAYHYLTEAVRVPPERILYFGESLGAAVVTELATEHPPAGLVLRSPFVDLATVGQVHYPFLPVRALLWDRYPVAQQLGEVHEPVTVVLGAEDSIVPPEQSRAVAHAAPRLHDLVEVAAAGHNAAVLLDGDVLVTAVVDLADHVDRSP